MNESLKKVINIAKAEEGYVEKATNQNLDSKTGNPGKGNYQKYSRDVNNSGLKGYQGCAWCATHQFWIEIMSSDVDTALKRWNMTKDTYVGYNCFATYNAFKSVGKVGKTPKLGALVIFTFSHMGRVIDIYEKNGKQYFSCEEGNTGAGSTNRNGGEVRIKERPVDESTIEGFCYISYDLDESQSNTVEGFRLASDGKRWWYEFADKTWAVGWHWLTEKTKGTSGWYYFDKDGYMLTGYQQIDGKHYLLCPDKDHRAGQCMMTDCKGALYIPKEYDFEKGRYIEEEPC